MLYVYIPSHLSLCTFARFHGDQWGTVRRRSPPRRACSQNNGPPGDTVDWSKATSPRVWASGEPAVPELQRSSL